MTREDEQWRMPELQRLGGQFRDLQNAEAAASRRRPRRRGRRTRRVVPVLVALTLAAAVLEVVTPAGASSPVSRAPAAAARSRSVRFTSSLSAIVNGRLIATDGERGELDFQTGNYATIFEAAGEPRAFERRGVDGALYLSEPVGHGQSPPLWLAFPAQDSASVMAARRDFTLIDPQIIFRVLETAPSHVAIAGQEKLNGTPTTRYRLPTSLAAFLMAQHESPRLIGAYAGTPGVLEVWLDKFGRPRRVQTVFTAASASRKASMVTTVDFRGYGLPVAVRAPTHAQRARASQLPSALAGAIRVLQRLLFTGP